MKILYLHDTGQQKELPLEQLIANLDESGWRENIDALAMSEMLEQRGWFEGFHNDNSAYLVLDLERLDLRRKPHLVSWH